MMKGTRKVERSTLKLRKKRNQLVSDHLIKIETYGCLGRIKITSRVNKCHSVKRVLQDTSGSTVEEQ